MAEDKIEISAAKLSELTESLRVVTSDRDRCRDRLDHLGVAVLVVADLGGIVYSNERAWALFGYQPHELVAIPFDALWAAPFWASPPMATTRRAMTVTRTVRARHSSGREFDVRVRPVPSADGHETVVAIWAELDGESS